MKLLARWKSWLCPPPQRTVLQLVALAHGSHTVTTLLITAFQEHWDIQFASSPRGAVELSGEVPTGAVVCDWDSYPGAWRDLCGVCYQCRVPFYLTATNPSDDLFLAVACAGGAGVWWKPLRADQMIAALGCVRSLTGIPSQQAVLGRSHDPHFSR